MKTLAERIAFLVSQRGVLEKWVGGYDEVSLRKWLDAELGDSRRLESCAAQSGIARRQWQYSSRCLPIRVPRDFAGL